MSSTTGTNEPGLHERVCQLWADLVPQAGRGTFTDCGGDSLSGLRLIGAVYGICGVRMTWNDLSTAADADDFAARVTAVAGA